MRAEFRPAWSLLWELKRGWAAIAACASPWLAMPYVVPEILVDIIITLWPPWRFYLRISCANLIGRIYFLCESYRVYLFPVRILTCVYLFPVRILTGLYLFPVRILSCVSISCANLNGFISISCANFNVCIYFLCESYHVFLFPMRI